MSPNDSRTCSESRLTPYELALSEQTQVSSPAWKDQSGAIAASMGMVTGRRR